MTACGSYTIFNETRIQSLTCYYYFQMSSTEGKIKADLDNHANQCNPNNPNYQGHTSGYSGTATKADLDNHANQLNPNNSKFQAPKSK